MIGERATDERRALRQKARTATLDALRALGGEGQRRAIVAHALERGGFDNAELALLPPEHKRESFDRLIDYELSWVLTNLKRDGLVENPRWSVWRLAGAAVEVDVPASDEVVEAARVAELATMAYRDYLRTPEWRRTRAAALLRAGDRCSLDATHDGPLDVHHNNYERRGRELAGDLVVLCQDCHRLHHKAYGRPGKRVPEAPVSEPVIRFEAAPKRPFWRRLIGD